MLSEEAKAGIKRVADRRKPQPDDMSPRVQKLVKAAHGVIAVSKTSMGRESCIITELEQSLTAFDKKE